MTRVYDFLLVTLGSLAARIGQHAMLFKGFRISAARLACRRLWLAVDTNLPPEWRREWDPSAVVELLNIADSRGRERARDYFEKVICRSSDELVTAGLLPDALAEWDLSEPLVSDFANPEATRNPWKGLVFLLANAPRVREALLKMERSMTGADRTIVVLFSPTSGTAAGGWLLLFAMVREVFPKTRPILVCVMPSRLRGRPEHVERSYAIFGWNARLLQYVTREGLTVNWKIPVLGGVPIEIELHRQQPLFTWLVSATRRAGGVDLQTTDELVTVLGKLLALNMVGQWQGRGSPNLYSHVLNWMTDARLDELRAQVTDAAGSYRPTRRLNAQGFMTVSLQAGLATEILLLALRRDVERTLLSQPTGTEGTPSVELPLSKSVGNGAEAAVERALRRHLERRVRSFLDQWWPKTGEIALQRRTATGQELLEEIDRVGEGFASEINDVLANWRDERAVHKELWDVLKRLPPSAFVVIPQKLERHAVDEHLVLQWLPEHELDQVDDHLRRDGGDPSALLHSIIHRHRARAHHARKLLLLLEEPSPPDRRRKLAMEAVDRLLKAVVLEKVRDGLLPLLAEVYREYGERIRRLAARVNAALKLDQQAFGEYEPVLCSGGSCGRDVLELAYTITAEKLKDHGHHPAELAARWLCSLDDPPDDVLRDANAVRASVARIVQQVEDMTAFPTSTAAVLRYLTDHPELLRLVTDRARALIGLRGERYAIVWGLWVSGPENEELEGALLDFQEAMRSVLAGEEFTVTVNSGNLQLENPADVLVVLSELALNFSLPETISDRPLEDYLAADDRASAPGMLHIHRLHAALLGEAGAERRHLAQVPRVEHLVNVPASLSGAGSRD